MKVHLIKKQSIERYVRSNAQSKVPFSIWLSTIKYVDWSEPSDIAKTFGSADILGGGSDRIVFNIGGNKYRMICKYYFGNFKIHLFIKWIGTHAEYTKLCKNGKQFLVSLF